MNSYIPPASFKGGRYVPKKVLGTGTYGQVLLCADTLARVDVAIKVAQCNPAYRRSALNEICALQKLLDNVNCVRLLDVFEDDGHVCIVTELLDKNLFELLRDRGFSPLTISDVRKVGRCVLQALTALHGVGFIHCDIKPENIMLRKQLGVDKFSNNALAHINEHASKVIPQKTIQSEDVNGVNDYYQIYGQDEFVAFSLSSSSDSDEAEVDFDHTCLIDFGAIRQFRENDYYDVQSLWYRAPEVLCGLPYSAKIDSWSAGCLLAELYCGKPLFPGENVEDQLSCIIQLSGYPYESALKLGSNVGQLRLPEARTDRQATTTQLSNWIRICRHNSLQAHENQLTPQSHPQNHKLGTDRLPRSSCNGGILNVLVNSESNLYNMTPSTEEALLLDLILRLLCPDEHHRLSCEEALQHPFLNTSPCNTYTPFPFTNFTQQRPASNGLSMRSSFQTSLLIDQTTSPASGFAPGGYSPSLVKSMSPSDLNFHLYYANIPPSKQRPVHVHVPLRHCRENYFAPDVMMSKTCLMPEGGAVLSSNPHPTAGGPRPSPYYVMLTPPVPSPQEVYRIPMVVPITGAGFPQVNSQQKAQPQPPQPTLYTPVYVSIANKRVTPAAVPQGGAYHHNSTNSASHRELRQLGVNEPYLHRGSAEAGGRLHGYPCHPHYVAPRSETVVAYP